MPACTAWHEAGHALVAEHAGIEVLSVTVHADGSGGHVDRGLFRDPASARWDAFPLMMAGGLAAEELYQGDPDIAWGHASGDRLVLRNLGHSETEVIGWAREARSIIEARRPAWARLAHVLAGGGTFPGELVRSVLDGQPADGRLALAALEQRKAPAW